MRLLVLASLHRHLDNISDALRRVRSMGGTVQILLTPFLDDTGTAKLLAADCGSVHVQEIPGETRTLWQQNFPVASVVARIVALVAEYDLEAVLLTENFLHPWHTLRDRLRAAGLTVPVIACQHGLVSPWQWGDRYRTCDFFFAFSRRHADLAKPTVTKSALVSGLPKLDRLRGIDRSDAGHDVLVLSSPMPHTDEGYQQLVEALPDALRRPVFMRGHPMYPGATSAAIPAIGIVRALALASDPMPTVLARIGLAVGAHSTSLLEAMVAGVPTVVLPVRRYADAYPDHPCLAADLTIEAFKAAERIASNEPERVRAYLPTIIHDPDASHTERFIQCLREVIADT